MRTRLTIALGGILLLAGCAVPRWVPFIGKSEPKDPPRRAARANASEPTTKQPSAPEAKPAEPGGRPSGVEDDRVADRVVAVVNNDAITLGELQQSILAYRQEKPDPSGPSDTDLAKQFLTRLIEGRLQLQEADREKIIVDDLEVTDELNDRIKKIGAANFEEFEAAVRAQGVTVDTIRKRLREGLRIAKVVRRKVGLRVSVTEEEIDRYLAENRPKLETGLAYHARHILIVPDSAGDAGWTAASARAATIHAAIERGEDFAELAREHSDDATTARDGGDLGTLKRGELAEDVERRIIALAAGQISAPYRSSLGYHIFRLESKEGLEGDGLVRVRQQIHDILFREKYEARLETWLKEIKQRAIIGNRCGSVCGS